MNSPRIGDIYEYYATYRDDPAQGKLRPIVILHLLDNGSLVAAAAITSKNHNAHFSHLKFPIINWRSKQTGLTSMSWVAMDHIVVIEPKVLKKRLGQMHTLDLLRLIEELNSL